jgi:UDP-glucose 4-epimerase
MQKVLVTGGAGYIGSHTTVELLNAGYEVAVLDNLSNSKEAVIQRMCEITGKDFPFYKVDLLDEARLEEVFSSFKPDAVIHFAALKAVPESVEQPLRYYHNNITGTINLLYAMQRHQVKNVVFSSSATVYGTNEQMPLREDFPLQSAINPYGQTKLMMEWIFSDVHKANPDKWNIALLRYFNPIGAHASGRIGEDPTGYPYNLLPYVAQVAVGRREYVMVYGDDYKTPDGTPIRDYIHVVDLALGHIKALEKLAQDPGLVVYNLGTGKGSTVFEVIHAFERAAGKKIPYKMVGRRAGDLPISYADPSKAERELGWKTTRTLDDMCVDVWRWQSANPNGYE